jgi:hypothetical protein
MTKKKIILLVEPSLEARVDSVVVDNDGDDGQLVAHCRQAPLSLHLFK